MYRIAIMALCCSYAGVAASDVIASRTLRVGTILTSADIEHPQGRDQAVAASQILGKELRRAIYAGRLVTERDVGPPTLVRRNDVVTMVFRSGSLGLRTQGRSLGAGGIGEVVEILNLDTRVKVHATVTGENKVEVVR